MKSKNKPTMIALSVAVLFLAGCNDEKKVSVLNMFDNIQVDKKAVVTAEKATVEPVATTRDKDVPNPATDTTATGSKKRAANYPKSDSSISNQVAIAEIEAGNPYTSIVSEVEGFRATPYSDVGNGFAVGNGWNMSFQSSANNRAWATKAGIDSSMINSIVSINGRKQGTVPSGIEITPKQATAVAMAMKPTFEQPAIRLFGQSAWSKLQDNQRGVLTYHIEKVGPGGASKYKGLIKAVQTYANSPTDGNAQSVVSHITYGYKIHLPDGSTKQMQDHRSQLYMGALFIDTQQYRYLLGKATAPKGFATTAKTAGFNIDQSKSAQEQIAQQDEFNNEIDTLAEQGIVPTIKQEIDGKTISYSMDITEPTTKPVCTGTANCKQEPLVKNKDIVKQKVIVNNVPQEQAIPTVVPNVPVVHADKRNQNCPSNSDPGEPYLYNGKMLYPCYLKIPK